jgi:hypothetical protein
MDTLELLAKNEEEISELYKLYAKILPQYEYFWLRLADEEVAHAAWIRDFANGIEKGTLFLNKKRFPVASLNTYHEYLKKSMKEASLKSIEPIQIFTTALYLEKSLVELAFFEVIDTGSEDFDKVVLRLREATKSHVKKIEEYWSKVKDKKM